MVPRLLPQSWTDIQGVLITANITDGPYLSGRNYIIKQNRYKIVFSSPKLIELGDRLVVFGKPNVKVIGKKQVEVVLYDPSIKQVYKDKVSEFSVVEKVKIQLVKFRKILVKTLQKSLPEPHSTLAAGILLGVKGSISRDFYDALVKTGTLHVIAASGYNVSIVIKIVMGLVLLKFSRRVGLVVGFVAVVSYVVMAGGSAAVVRAAIMGIMSYSAYYWGRVADAKRLVWVVGWIMVMYDPLYLVDVGFQLSFAATIGILYLEPRLRMIKWGSISRRITALVKYLKLEGYLSETVFPSLAATISTMPILLWWFGRVSLISTFVNILVLWTVPIVMFLASIVVTIGMISFPVARILSLVLYLPLEWFVRVVEVFGG